MSNKGRSVPGTVRTMFPHELRYGIACLQEGYSIVKRIVVLQVPCDPVRDCDPPVPFIGCAEEALDLGAPDSYPSIDHSEPIGNTSSRGKHGIAEILKSVGQAIHQCFLAIC
jgi:hypothetical protein